ncbi:MAG: HepT-like ribonuclease domain-containing protein [Candidatus Saccharimonadales bacterium]
MPREPLPNLKFILETLQTIKKFTPKDKIDFLNDRNVQDATLMRLQDIGEQLSRIRDTFPEFYEENHSDDWYKLIGLRNIISHGYREIDFEIIWDVVTTKLSDFENNIKRLV